MPLFEHPFLELTVEDESVGVAFGEELWDLAVLLNYHERVTGQLEPPCEGVLGDELVAVEQEAAQAVNSAELIDVAPRHPLHLLNGFLLAASEGLLQAFFQLTRGQQFDVHSVHAAILFLRPVIEVHCVAVLIFKLPEAVGRLFEVRLHMVDLSLRGIDFLISRITHVP